MKRTSAAELQESKGGGGGGGAIRAHHEQDSLLVIHLRVDEPDDLGVPAKLLEEVDLIDEARARFGVVATDVDALEGEEPVALVEDAVDARAPALAEHTDAVVADAVDLREGEC